MTVMDGGQTARLKDVDVENGGITHGFRGRAMTALFVGTRTVLRALESLKIWLISSSRAYEKNIEAVDSIVSKSASEGFPEFTTGTNGSLSAPWRTIWSSVDAAAKRGRTSRERRCRRMARAEQIERAGMKAIGDFQETSGVEPHCGLEA